MVASDAAKPLENGVHKENGTAKTSTIDMRSDTVTKPSDKMRLAMMQAEVGDDVYSEDPSVNRLQEEAARICGMEAALFVSSGTMGNLSAVLAWCTERGSEVIVGSESHVYMYEAGGMSVLGGVAFNVVPTRENGELPLDMLKKAVRPDDMHAAKTALVCLENTHNRCGGRVLSLDYMASVAAWAKSKGLPVHLDGARVFNAAAALGCPVSDITQHVSSVQICLSKGLGAPCGSIVAGPKDFIARVFRYRKLLGGAMRQSGVLAAPGLIALLESPSRLAEDHANAQLFAQEVAKVPGIILDPSTVQSNIVIFCLAPDVPVTPVQLVAALEPRGVLMIPFGALFVERGVRATTHVDVSRDQVMEAVKQVAEVMQSASVHAKDPTLAASVLSPYG